MFANRGTGSSYKYKGPRKVIKGPVYVFPNGKTRQNTLYDSHAPKKKRLTQAHKNAIAKGLKRHHRSK